jgi:hypothetical protein
VVPTGWRTLCGHLAGSLRAWEPESGKVGRALDFFGVLQGGTIPKLDLANMRRDIKTGDDAVRSDVSEPAHTSLRGAESQLAPTSAALPLSNSSAMNTYRARAPCSSIRPRLRHDNAAAR